MVTLISVVLVIMITATVNSDVDLKEHNCCVLYKKLPTFSALINRFKIKLSNLNVTTDAMNPTYKECEEISLSGFNLKNKFKPIINKVDLIRNVYKTGKYTVFTD